MSPIPVLSLAIVGLGVIGGSLAKAFTRKGIPLRAFSPQRAERDAARVDGIVVSDTLDRPFLEGASAVVIAVPLDQIASVAREVRRFAPGQTILLHTGSLQRHQAIGVDQGDLEWLIGTHPLAGSEGSGYGVSSAALFVGATVSADSSAPVSARNVIETLWRSAGANVIWTSVDDHDHTMTWLSHLPQLASTALALTVSRAGLPAGDGGPGLRDSTRLAASSLLMWRPILDAASPECIIALRELERSVADLRSALETGDQELLSEMWTTARGWRAGTENTHAS